MSLPYQTLLRLGYAFDFLFDLPHVGNDGLLHPAHAERPRAAVDAQIGPFFLLDLISDFQRYDTRFVLKVSFELVVRYSPTLLSLFDIQEYTKYLLKIIV